MGWESNRLPMATIGIGRGLFSRVCVLKDSNELPAVVIVIHLSSPHYEKYNGCANVRRGYDAVPYGDVIS